ncbi:MAG TPA: hypothetical protein PLF96_09930 [Thermotogota bacterium]|nr:hypothetical protein [Thermotogota bacterium]
MNISQAVDHSKNLLSSEPPKPFSTTKEVLSIEVSQGFSASSGEKGGNRKKNKLDPITATTNATRFLFPHTIFRFSGKTQEKTTHRKAARSIPKYTVRVWARSTTVRQIKRLASEKNNATRFFAEKTQMSVTKKEPAKKSETQFTFPKEEMINPREKAPGSASPKKEIP